MPERPILIIGGAGKTGGRVDTRLKALGIATRPASRSTAVPFDWGRPESWPAALDGVSKAYVTYQPDLAVESAADDIAALADLARRMGLEQLVLLSGRGEPSAMRAETALQASGVAWTIVRASWFNQNFSEGYLIDGVLAGEIALPAGTVREPFVDADDIADLVVAALTDARHRDRLYEVTGPQAITFAEAVAEIANAAGRPIRYRQISSREFVDGMRQAGVPDDIAMLLNELFAIVLDGRNSGVTRDIEEALGRPARDFSAYARAAAAAGSWSV